MKYLILFLLCFNVNADVTKYIYRVVTPIGGHATTFALTYKGKNYLVTNWHVCESRKFLEMSHETSINNIRTYKVLKVKASRDLCIAEFDKQGLELGTELPIQVKTYGHSGGYEKMSYSSGSLVGQVIVNLLFPYNDHCPFTYVKRYTFTGEYCSGNIEVIDTTLKVKGGASGSPVLDLNNKVVGVINSTNGIYGSMIHFEYLKQLLEEIRNPN